MSLTQIKILSDSCLRVLKDKSKIQRDATKAYLVQVLQ